MEAAGTKRAKSPRAPSQALDEAINRISKMYQAEGRHPAPLDVAMKHIGYGSRNGSALQAMASLGYWGLVERIKDERVMVTKEYEELLFVPDESRKQELLIKFLRNPPVFAELLDKYHDRLPSDATIKFDLIRRGFMPATADTCMAVFKRSVEFVGYYDKSRVASPPSTEALQAPNEEEEEALVYPSTGIVTSGAASTSTVSEQDRQIISEAASSLSVQQKDLTVDRIPVRLAGGRRAWLEIPMPFFSADKKRLKRHIDLLLTDDEDELDDEQESSDE